MKKITQLQKQISKLDFGLFVIFILINFIMICAILIFSSNEKLDFLIFKFNMIVFIILILYRIMLSYQHYRIIKNKKLFKSLLEKSFIWLSNIEHLSNSINNLQSCLKDIDIHSKNEEVKLESNEYRNTLLDSINGLNESISKLNSSMNEEYLCINNYIKKLKIKKQLKVPTLI